MNEIKKNGGFALPEMLISTAIGAIILAALFVSFVMFQRSYELQREMTRNQENARILFDSMVEEIRNAGYNDYNQGNPVPINQAVILEAPEGVGAAARARPNDCGQQLSIMYDIVPSENDRGTNQFIRRRVKYFGETFLPGGNPDLERCRLKREQCHYSYNSVTSAFSRINNNNKYPCEDETILDYLYNLSFGIADYKYDVFAGRVEPMMRPNGQDVRSMASQNYATAACLNRFLNNQMCTQYPNRARSVDIYLSLVSGKEISSVPVNAFAQMGRRFVTNYYAGIVLRNQ